MLAGGLVGRGQPAVAAVAPNGQTGKCGQYYIWYQTGPDQYAEYVDLCSITFGISDVIDDFDFVYFTDSASLQRSDLDPNRDGVSDEYFWGRQYNQLKWEPPEGCVRITQWACWKSRFNPNCGYAMISIQPKPGFEHGRAEIPIHVSKRCPPNGADCSEDYTVVHAYAGCESQLLPEFTIHKQIDTTSSSSISYELFIRNTGNMERNTVVTDTVTGGTKGGRLRLVEFDMDCPHGATCNVLQITNNQLKIALTNVDVDDVVRISYTMEANREEIPRNEISYFTNTATLSTGESAQVTEGVKGLGDKVVTEPARRRPERPRQGKRGRP
jgi:hypothetical protein